MKQFLIALQFLTIFPVKISSDIRERDFGASLLYFPFVGLLIGLFLFLTAFLFSFLPGLLKGAVILITSTIITGGIHLDGFADTCDGFYGSKPKEEILRIMRDSRVGVMGVIGAACLLLLKFSLIVSIPESLLWKSLILMAAFSRWSQALSCLAYKYARSEGKAKYFIEYVRKKDIFIGAIFSLGLFLLLLQFMGLLLFSLSMLAVFLFMRYINKKIDGMTGDTIGAISEISEVAVLFFGLIFTGINL